MKYSLIIESLHRNRLQKIVEEYPIDLPKVSMPIKESELKVLYTYINKKYFGNQLPQARLKMAPLAKNFHGKTHVTWDDNGKIKDILITMATINANNLDATINTLVHEMIHVWQYFMCETTGDRKYADDAYNLFSFGEVNTRGHGNYFKQQMDRLNGEGFNIEKESGVTPEMELTKEMYGIIFYISGDEVVFLTTPTDPTRDIGGIIENVEEKMGESFFTSYTIFKSLDSRMLLGTRLTKNLQLPKNNFRITYIRSAIDEFLHSRLSKIIKVSEPEDIIVKGSSDNIPKDLVPTLQSIHKYRPSSWDTYFKTCILNTAEFKHLGNIVGIKLNGILDIEHGITQEVIDTIKKDWMDISDVEIKRSQSISSMITDVRFAMMTKKTPIEDKKISEFQSKYDSDFKERVDFQRFLKLFYEVLGTELLKNMKKSPSYTKDMDKTMPEIIRRLFVGTQFELR